MMEAVGSSSPNPNDYEPISTLEQQYIDPPLGRRLTLLLRLSPSCLDIPGGVETVLRSTRPSSNRRNHQNNTNYRSTIDGVEPFEEPAVEAIVECDVGEISLKEINVSGGEDDSIDGSRCGGRSRSSSVDGGGGEGGGRGGKGRRKIRSNSPFRFLYEEGGDKARGVRNKNTQRHSGNTNGGGDITTDVGCTGGVNLPVKKQFGGFSNFKNNLKKGWDRQVTSIVLQAQKVAPGGGGTGTRDLLTVGAYVRDGRSKEYNTCLGMTERAEIPTVEGNGLVFRIPIVVPPGLLEKHLSGSGGKGGPSGEKEPVLDGDGALIQFQIWIRSGAAIFAKSRGLRSYYPVGFTSLYAASLRNVVVGLGDGDGGGRNNPSSQPQSPAVLHLPIQSEVVKGGMMTVTVLGDLKFPERYGNGWSLTDPSTETAYNDYNGKKMFFNPPLDQSFVFPLPPSPLSRSELQTNCLVTTERSTESTVILPLALAVSRLLSTAAQKSFQHSLILANHLLYLHGARSVPRPEDALTHNHAMCRLDLLYLIRSSNDAPGAPGMGGGKVSVTVHLQRPDSIFENCMATGTIPTYTYSTNVPSQPAMTIPFYPRLVRKGDSRMLPGLDRAANAAYPFLLGKIRMEIYEEGIANAGVDVFSPIGPTSTVGITPKSYDIMIDVEPYVNQVGREGRVEKAMVVDSMTGQSVGVVAFRIFARVKDVKKEVTLLDFGNGETNVGAGTISEAAYGGASLIDGGLISLMGMDTLMADDKVCFPYSDLQSNFVDVTKSKPPSNATPEMVASHRRRKQIATMGEFLTFDYIDQHAGINRATNAKTFLQRADEYQRSLHSQGSDVPASLTPDERRDPRPFRPSSSRMDPLLCGIGFNVHVHNISLLTVSTPDVDDENKDVVKIASHSLFQNITCGAPSDHYQGFSGTPNDQKRFSGGLRRLESNRVAAAQRVRETQDSLISAVAQYYNDMTIGGRSGIPASAASMRHVPSNNMKIMRRRQACIEATQVLHELTWNVAVRRGNVFSQALGIALTVYLTQVSDYRKLSEGVWADVWKHHGFMIVFEGLLSAAGKELGMIEDASVGIAMLRMVSVVIRPEDYMVDTGGRVPVPESPYIVWLAVTPSGTGARTRFLVEVGVDMEFYQRRVPVPLQNGTEVRFYPLLYQMGVDIRQWGANAGANMARRHKSSAASGSDDELEEDESSHANHDVLKSLNYEAFRKMNGYAHSVSPCKTSPSSVGGRPPSWESAHYSQQQVLHAIHPSLISLYEYIRTSAGKMEHGILDEAATAAARLGGGSAIFCKSGKDRTAMQVTFKQAQFVSRVMENKGNGFGNAMDKEQVLKNATLMRVYGTRLPICEKNVGQAMFAFNSLQAKFMPDMLKPPPRTLAGFLKGGRIFSKGGIES